MAIETRSDRIFVAGDHNVVKQFPLFGKGEPLYLWAENGMVCWEFAKSNTYGSMDWRDAGRRVLSLSEMVGRSSEDGVYTDERQALQKFISDMERVIRQAREQGGPNDDGVAEDRRRRRAKSVVVPRAVDKVDPFPEIF